ncbi:DNA cytosine methyltransferase [Heyndrickxia sporothermodurans]|uniref:DNA cytosine methyltransferase n=1 Tax=Heyndrickxia sporothermodurans TaxID=46224 RepID=UPI002DB55E35|nr:DNA cytosine methyltransferase [Heyndrickxia sporothermodurans]MEB6549698.1 DNA cytosine methyltransferase [Heyndrickxia sporothermodurans]
MKKAFKDKKQQFTAVSLFSGAGGLDIGFENQGFKTVWANDSDKDACATHQKWSDAEVVCGKIEDIDFSTIPNTDAIFGGFPCQGFSLSGPRKIDDSRNTLYKYFVKLVEEKKPYVFIAENVKGILTLGDGAIFEAIIEDFKNKGYKVFPKLLNASDYGVPQDRERVILVGFRDDLNMEEFVFPEPADQKVTLYDALKDIPEPLLEEICDAPYSSRFMSRNRKRDWNNVSYTIPAMAKQVPLHPSSPDMIKLDKDLWKFGEGAITRRFSWREAAIIQTFPQNLEFEGDLVSKYKQIGNAVPVKLAEAVAEKVYIKLKECLEGSNQELIQEVV